MDSIAEVSDPGAGVKGAWGAVDGSHWARIARRSTGATFAAVASVSAKRVHVRSMAGRARTTQEVEALLQSLLDRGPLRVGEAVRIGPEDPLVAGGAGVGAALVAPIRLPGGELVGCVAATGPAGWRWREGDLAGLQDVADAMGRELGLWLSASRGGDSTATGDARPLRASPGAVRNPTVRRREHYYQSLIENASDILAVLETDLRIRFASPAAARILGYAPREAARLRALDLIHPDDVSCVREAVRRMVELPGEAQTVQIRLRHASGEWRVHEARGTAWWDRARGRSRPAIIVNSRDITEREQAEEELRRTEERFELATRATSDVIWDWDFASDHILWNEMVGTAFRYAPQEVQPSYAWWANRIHPEDRERVFDSIRAALEEGTRLWTGEYRFLRGDGSYAMVLNRGYVVRSAEGVAVRMIGAMADVTERKQLEEQLWLSQRMEAVGRLAGGVAHDFNNLLMVILATTDLLLMELDGRDESESVRADIQRIRRAADRASTLTRQLLAFGRRQVLKPEVVDLNDLVTEVSAMLRPTLGEDIRLVSVLEPGLGRVRVDPAQFEQVVVNLAVNARDAMPQGGELTIETENAELTDADASRFAYPIQVGSYVRVTVRDTGCGMDPELQRHVFEPFFTTKREGGVKGTGLGLSTVYGIVKQSGGYIWMESQLGEGTTFRVYLPRVEAPRPEPVNRTESSLPKGSGTILLVEDEDAVRAVIRRVLERSGYAVLEASGGEEALAICERSRPGIDLLLTDVVMPGMSGRELADRLTVLDPDLQVLYMSGHTDDRILHHGIGSRSVDLIQKPFPLELLCRRVHTLLSGATTRGERGR